MAQKASPVSSAQRTREISTGPLPCFLQMRTAPETKEKRQRQGFSTNSDDLVLGKQVAVRPQPALCSTRGKLATNALNPPHPHLHPPANPNPPPPLTPGMTITTHGCVWASGQQQQQQQQRLQNGQYLRSSYVVVLGLDCY